MKKLLTLAAITASIIFLTACGKLNKRIDESIEEVGTDLTGVPVEVEKVRIKFGAVSGEIKGLTVANPNGYQTTNAFDLGLLKLNIGLLKTLGGRRILLDELVIDSPVLVLEFSEDGRSNFREIADNVKRNIEHYEEEAAGTPEPDAEDPDDEKKPVRISVRRLVIEGMTFYVRRADGTFRSGTLPSIELLGVGGDEGKSAAGLGAVIVLAMAGEMLKQAVAHQLAEGFTFEADKVLVWLEQRLSLSGEQLEGMKPAAVTLADALNQALASWSEQGFVDVDALSAELAPVLEEARAAVEQVLDSDQLEEFSDILAGIDEEALEAVRNSLVERLAAALQLREEQVLKLKPILRQHIEKLGALVTGLTTGSNRSFESFTAEYDALRSSTRAKLLDVLDPAQMDALDAKQDEISERVRGLLL